jgi:hypothetical protein
VGDFGWDRVYEELKFTKATEAACRRCFKELKAAGCYDKLKAARCPQYNSKRLVAPELDK